MKGWVRVASTIVALVLYACSDDPAPSPARSAPVEEPGPLALERYRVRWDPEARERALTEGRAVIERLECTRCHVVDEVAAAGRSEHCVSCHVFLDGLTPDDRRWATLTSRYGEDVMRRYQRTIEHYLAVPDLTGIARRLRPEFIRDYVASPFDLRPSMEEAMVRVRASDDDVRAITRYFAAIADVADPYAEDASAPAPPELVRDEQRIARGRQLFQERGCNACHYVGNLRLGRTEAQIRGAGTAARLAPNLRFVRERMHPDVVVDWIVDPARIAPGTLMPNLHVRREDAELIRDFLWFADPELQPTPAAPRAELPPPVDRPVSWEEVKERVLGRVCVHCHMNDHERDRGPGSQGGWGWSARGVRFRTYEALVAGMPGADGGHVSLVETPEGASMPLLLEAMLRRRDEERRDHVLPFRDHERPPYAGDAPGMPMGLPSIPDDEIAIVRAWIEQGCPGPTSVTGMPGITDGLLVPDGPIAANHGCEVRAPMEPRPEWASHPPPEWARDERPAAPAATGAAR